MANLHRTYLDTYAAPPGQRTGFRLPGGGDGPLGIYCVQHDRIYVEGRSVSLDQAEALSEQLAQLELKLANLKTLLSVNKLLEPRT